MRLCRYRFNSETVPTGDPARIGIYFDDTVVSLDAARVLLKDSPRPDADLLDYLPGGSEHQSWKRLRSVFAELLPELERIVRIPVDAVQLLAPIPTPSKILLLAGNYSKHIEEGGGKAEERAKTFPYVFMKPVTTLTNPGDPVRIPAVSPDHIDWELELGVIIGKRCKGVSEAEALNYVAGYTVVNDISDRVFRPNPGRNQRPKDSFFDWQHGKWHDTFCPMGPCVLPADDCPDPQKLAMTLKVNGHIEQDASTADMVFPVAAVVSFVSSFVTLEPGDIISTGTPDGVGHAKGKYLKRGDVVEAAIDGIGVLRNPVE
jgi:2-keto-4-pentenoate hydratase/2-oxohepta-3-ene-1,7-dioic acid hydratase in catechol pathway